MHGNNDAFDAMSSAARGHEMLFAPLRQTGKGEAGDTLVRGSWQYQGSVKLTLDLTPSAKNSLKARLLRAAGPGAGADLV